MFPSLDIEVDGGVGPDTIHKCAEVRTSHTSRPNRLLRFLEFKMGFFFSFPAPGRSQHDRVGQRSDRQRGPPLRHRPPPHRRGRRHPETLPGPLSWSAPLLYLPVDAADSRTVVLGGEGGSGTAFRLHHLPLLSKRSQMFDIRSRTAAGFTFVNIPEHCEMFPQLFEI